MGLNELNQAHLYILNNTQEVVPYIAAHKEFLKDNHPKMSKKQLLQKHNKSFLKWFTNTIFGDNNAYEMLRNLANGPNQNVRTWKGYDINNYSFYTKSQDDKSKVQNSGVSLDVESKHFCSASNNNPKLVSMPYFGVIEEIWKLDYSRFRVPIFKCKWVNDNSTVQIADMGFTLVDPNKVAYKDKPFIMAKQAKKIIFMSNIPLAQDGQWFYKVEQVVLVMNMVIQHLIFFRLLVSPNLCLPSLKNMKWTMYMQIAMIIWQNILT